MLIKTYKCDPRKSLNLLYIKQYKQTNKTPFIFNHPTNLKTFKRFSCYCTSGACKQYNLEHKYWPTVIHLKFKMFYRIKLKHINLPKEGGGVISAFSTLLARFWCPARVFSHVCFNVFFLLYLVYIIQGLKLFSKT